MSGAFSNVNNIQYMILEDGKYITTQWCTRTIQTHDFTLLSIWLSALTLFSHHIAYWSCVTYFFSVSRMPSNTMVKDLVTEPMANSVSPSTDRPFAMSLLPNPRVHVSFPMIQWETCCTVVHAMCTLIMHKTMSWQFQHELFNIWLVKNNVYLYMYILV